MAKDEDFRMLKIQTHVLRVNIHCDGCKDKVKKILTKIEGVFSVNIDMDHQKVSVVGSVDADTLIRKLNRAGKYSELWSNKPNNNISNHKQSNNAPQKNQKQNNAPQNQNQNQHQKHNQNPNSKDQGKQNLMQGLKTFKNQHKGGKLPELYSDDDFSDEYDDDDEDGDFDEEDLRVLGEKMGQLNFLRQMNGQAQAGNNHGNNNKNQGNNNNINAGNNNNAKKNGNGNGQGNNGKKNQNANIPNQQGKNANVQGGLNFAGGNNGKMMPNIGALGGDHAKRLNGLNGMHPMNGMMGGGLHGASGFNNGHQANVGGGGGAINHQNHNQAMMMGMHHQRPPTMVAGNNNIRNGNMMMMHDGARYVQQQPQMMYARSPQVMPYTGYYGYNPNPNLYYGYNNGYYASPYHGESAKNGDGIGYMFSDENTKSCAIM